MAFLLALLPHLVLAVSLGGCALDDPRNRALVLLDREAVASGATVHQEPGLSRSSALPILVEPDLPTDVENGTRSIGQRLEVGELLWVRGPELSVTTLRLGVDVERDRLALRAEPEAARELASVLSGRLHELAAGGYELELVNAFTHAAFAPADGVHELLPIELGAPAASSPHGAPAPSLDAPLDAAMAVGARSLSLPALASAPDPVGIYRSEHGRLMLDASGRFRACLPELHASSGTYRLQGQTLTLRAGGETLRLHVDAAGALTHESGIALARHGGPTP